MFNYATVKVARTYGPLIDRQLRRELVGAIKPLRHVPCFLHRWIDSYIRRSKAFPVLIQFKKGNSYTSGVTSLKRIEKNHANCKVKRSIPRFALQSANLTASALEDFCHNCGDIEKVYLDREFNALLDTATETTRASELQNELEATGEGVTVAIIDTGVHPSPDLMEPEQRIIGFRDFINDREDPYDDNGHGTHCAGDAAGNGQQSDGEYAGPAPDANIVGVKVLNKMGAGSLTDIIAGVDWCIENQEAYDIRILSLSLGSPAIESEDDDPVVEVVNQAWDEGMVVCVAAGNEGPSEETISSPGISEKIITVGALDEQGTPDRSDDDVAEFSSRGPTIDGHTKPDILAPGVDITSIRSANSFLDKYAKSDRINDHYISMSGTSMATPICAGVCAQLLELNSNLDPDMIKAQLREGAEDLGLEENTQGEGSLDAVQSADEEDSTNNDDG
ncbi:S8 family peptidase [Salicibibacter kimchii]|uniref:Peptidase S8 n=1 Tax=Salicibibacter kimchii TaxID=2099786 RepID=A0A345C2D6_9BACI|nr:S8 family peptidase [Salicibibacter kimchii]AXF57367.1 peptidase S8 [Salicibibacter kimchii]